MLEIERKWLVNGWPSEKLPLLCEHKMRQGYVTVSPTVRIREEALTGGRTDYILCFKSEGEMARRELEISIEKERFRSIEDFIEKDLIEKVRRTYSLEGGLKLEVNHVDEGLDTEFWYAEVEFPDMDTAESWDPADAGVGSYLDNEVTGIPGETMGAYWLRTRK